MGVVLSDAAREDLRDRLVDAAKRAIQGDPGNTIGGQPVSDFLAGPEPTDPLGKFQHRGGRRACDLWAAGGRPGILPGRDLYYRKLCEPYLGSGAPGDATTAPPFTGGQCTGNYFVRGTFEYGCLTPAGQTGQWQTQFPIPGPISGVDSLDSVWRVRGGNGQSSTIAELNFGGNSLNEAPRSGVTCSQVADQFAAALNVKITQVIPQGFTDNCGSPPEEFDPGAPGTGVGSPVGPVGGPTGFPFPNVDIDVNPDGSISVDFGDGSPPETFDPQGDPATGTPPPPSPGTPGASDDSGLGGESEGEAGDGEELVGVLVQVLSAPQGANQFDNIPSTVYRGIGYVAMGYPGRLGVDTSAAVVNSPQFFHAQQRGLTAWRVRANNGFNLRTTPYYRETE